MKNYFQHHSTGKLREIKNLRPILNYARKSATRDIVVIKKEDGARFLIYFTDGANAAIDFVSFRVCEDFANHPRRVWSGCPIHKA